MFENYNQETLDKRKRLGTILKILKRFVLAGTILLGSEIGLVPTTKAEVKNYSLAETMELIDEEDREIFLELTRNVIKRDIVIEEAIPSKDKEVSVEDIEKYLATLPEGWVKGEISSIGSSGEWREGFGMPSSALAIFYHESGRIVFNRDMAKTQKRGYNIHAISHEIAHGNDFLSDSNISWQERYSLYKRIKERLKSENRFRTHYLFKLENKFEQGKYGWLPMIREYWAETCAQYMSDPSQLHIDDFSLVHEFVMRNDPEYDWRKKLSERSEIQGLFLNPHIPDSEKR